MGVVPNTQTPKTPKPNELKEEVLVKRLSEINQRKTQNKRHKLVYSIEAKLIASKYETTRRQDGKHSCTSLGLLHWFTASNR